MVSAKHPDSQLVQDFLYETIIPCSVVARIRLPNNFSQGCPDAYAGEVDEWSAHVCMEKVIETFQDLQLAKEKAAAFTKQQPTANEGKICAAAVGDLRTALRIISKRETSHTDILQAKEKLLLGTEVFDNLIKFFRESACRFLGYRKVLLSDPEQLDEFSSMLESQQVEIEGGHAENTRLMGLIEGLSGTSALPEDSRKGVAKLLIAVRKFLEDRGVDDDKRFAIVYVSTLIASHRGWVQAFEHVNDRYEEVIIGQLLGKGASSPGMP